ncbi:hypothetical protein GNF79_21540, partial [Clostridium perfringens]|nr:hypothetical protein [Clostridium perfringens]
MSNVSNLINKEEQNITKVSGNVCSSTVKKDINIERNTKVNKLELDNVFNLVENTLSDYVLGQKDYLSKLAIAFRRPFVYGKEDGISNTIFITGPKGSGRHLSIKAISRFLKEYKILKSSEVL